MNYQGHGLIIVLCSRTAKVRNSSLNHIVISLQSILAQNAKDEACTDSEEKNYLLYQYELNLKENS